MFWTKRKKRQNLIKLITLSFRCNQEKKNNNKRKRWVLCDAGHKAQGIHYKIVHPKKEIFLFFLSNNKDCVVQPTLNTLADEGANVLFLLFSMNIHSPFVTFFFLVQFLNNIFSFIFIFIKISNKFGQKQQTQEKKKTRKIKRWKCGTRFSTLWSIEFSENCLFCFWIA